MSADLSDIFVCVRYHVWWPGAGDPYYLFNTADNRARANYYGVPSIGVPYFRIDGYIDGGANRNAWESMILNEADNWSPLVVSFTGSFDRQTLTGNFTASVYAEMEPGASNLKLRIALIENNIYWHAPNNTNYHHQTLRYMFPSAAGVQFSLSQGETFEYSSDFSTPAPLVAENCVIVAFVQSDQNRQVLQAGKVLVPDLVETGIDYSAESPVNFALSQNYPNPFNATTKIDFNTLGGEAKLEIFDLTGALVKTLIDGEIKAGNYSIVWDGENNSGNIAASGIYFYRLTAPDGQQIQRMTLLK